MNLSVSDAALKAAYSDEADELRRKSRKWFIGSQVFMLLAASPILLAFVGAGVSLFSGSESAFVWAGASFLGGVMATFGTMILFCPFAFYCIYRSFKSRSAFESLIADAVRRTDV